MKHTQTFESFLNEDKAIEAFWKGKKHKINKDFSVFEHPTTGELMIAMSNYKKDVKITDGFGNVNLVLTKDEAAALKNLL